MSDISVSRIRVTYCTNFNGVAFTVNGALDPNDMDDELFEAFALCEADITSTMVAQCAPGGEYYGPSDVAKNIIKTVVSKHFPAARISVAFDRIST